MELFGYFRSSAAYRVRIALNLKGIAYQQRAVNLVAAEQRSEDYLAFNPQGLVPALRLKDGTVLNQSPAILEWLETAFAGKPLLPSNPLDAARIRAWTNTIACDIHPLNNLRVLKYLSAELEVSDAQKNAWYHHWIALGFTALESQIKAAPYCDGSSVTMADVYLIPQVYNALRFNQDMSAYPKIMSVWEHCSQQQAFIDAHPDNQPDCPAA